MIQEMHNQLGQVVTVLAFLLNWLMGEHINAILTIVISVLSIVYLTLKISRELKGSRNKNSNNNGHGEGDA